MSLSKEQIERIEKHQRELDEYRKSIEPMSEADKEELRELLVEVFEALDTNPLIKQNYPDGIIGEVEYPIISANSFCFDKHKDAVEEYRQQISEILLPIAKGTPYSGMEMLPLNEQRLLPSVSRQEVIENIPDNATYEELMQGIIRFIQADNLGNLADIKGVFQVLVNVSFHWPDSLVNTASIFSGAIINLLHETQSERTQKIISDLLDRQSKVTERQLENIRLSLFRSTPRCSNVWEVFKENGLIEPYKNSKSKYFLVCNQKEFREKAFEALDRYHKDYGVNYPYPLPRDFKRYLVKRSGESYTIDGIRKIVNER